MRERACSFSNTSYKIPNNDKLNTFKEIVMVTNYSDLSNYVSVPVSLNDVLPTLIVLPKLTYSAFF